MSLLSKTVRQAHRAAQDATWDWDTDPTLAEAQGMLKAAEQCLSHWQTVVNKLEPSTDFRGHPPSVTELRSDRTFSAADWTPRDALIALLRKIDSGEELLSAIFISAKCDNGSVLFSTASSGLVEALGTIEAAKASYLWNYKL